MEIDNHSSGSLDRGTRSPLAVRGLYKHFGGVRAISNVTFSLAESTTTALIGPNGAGKSTLLHLISGLLQPDRGEIHILGRDIRHFEPYEIVRFGLGCTFQIPRTFENMTVVDNVGLAADTVCERLFRSMIGARSVRRISDDAVAKAHDCLKVVGLENKWDYKANALTHSERRLLELARLRALNSKVILLDEPMAGLSQDLVSKVETIVRDLRAEGKSVVLVDHNITSVMRVSDRILVIHCGNLIADGTPREIAMNPAVISAYFGKNGGSPHGEEAKRRP